MICRQKDQLKLWNRLKAERLVWYEVADFVQHNQHYTIHDAVDNNHGTATTALVSVAIGDDIRDVDAGIAEPGTASIGVAVFVDENGNGSFDDG